MKKKILLILLLLFPFIVNASAMYQDISIEENGDILVKEAISIDGSYNGFRLILRYKYLDENRIYSADSLQVIKVCESDKSNALNEIGDCFDEVSFANKGDSLKYTHTTDSYIDEFMFYNPSIRRKAFYIEYRLKNVIVNHNDIDELRLNMLDSSFSEDLDKIEIKVHLPKKSNDLRGWAHGPLWGNIEIDDNKEYVLFTIDDYDAYTKIDIRMAFDKDIVTSLKATNSNMLSKIVEEETILANSANQEREEIREQLKKAEEKEKFMTNLVYILSGTWFIGAIIYFIYLYNKYDKEYKGEFTGKYFRDFPSNDSPDIVEYLISKNITTNGMSACLLNIIYKKGLLVEETIIKEGLIFKKELKDYILTVNDIDLKEELTEQEKELRNFMVTFFGDGTKFNISEMKNVGNSESKSRKFISKYNKWLMESKKVAINKNFYIDDSSVKVLPILYGLIPILLLALLSEYSLITLITFFIGIIFIVYVLTIKKRTKDGNELYLKWNALKNFLEDFGIMDKKELPEIVLWEKYLVYASLFGIADKVREVMKIRLPEVSDDITNMNTFDYIFINNAINNSITTSVNRAVTSASSAIASSNNSSGGGFGGGFSGGSSGGGFSGGGGSGGGRF